MSVAAVTTDRVHDYRVAREAQELRLEAATGTRDAPSSRNVYGTGFYAETGAADLGGETPITWKMWLQQTTPPAPSPDDLAAVRDAELLRAWRAHDTADADRDRYERSAAARGAVFAELVAGDWSYAELGRALGVSHTAIHNAVKAHHNRAANALGDW